MSSFRFLTKKPHQWRFFFHYNKPESKAQGRNVLTLHWDKRCHLVNDIACYVPTETHTQKAQPHCIVRGWCHSVEMMERDGKTIAVIYP